MDDQKAIVAAALLAGDGRAATAAGDVGVVIRAARVALGWSQKKLSDRSGCSQATVSRIERGSTRAAQDAAVLTDVATALQVPLSAVGLASSGEGRPASAGSRVDEVRRRDMLAGAAALAASALLPQAIAAPSLIGAPEVEQARRSLARLFELDDHAGGVQVYEVASAMAEKLAGALNGGRCSSDVRAQLVDVTATTMELAGWLAFDAGQTGLARSWWLETSHLATDLASSPIAQTAALASMSLQASGDPRRSREVAALAQAASRVSGAPGGNTLRSVLAAREAVGHAQCGDRVSARGALAEARRNLGDGPSASDPLWLHFWSPADLACHEMRVAIALGDAAYAETSARNAVAAADESRFPRNHAVYSAKLGAVLTRRGKLDEAVAVTANAVKRIDQLAGSRRIVADLEATLGDLGTRDYAPARQFAQAARRLLPSA